MLAELIQEVCQHPPKSPQRRKAMNRFLITVQNHQELGKSNSFYRADAFNLTLIYVSKNLCTKFDYHQPDVEKRLVQWFNKTFYWRLRDLENSSKKDSNIPFQDWITRDAFNLSHRDLLDAFIEKIKQQNREKLVLKIENYLIEDPHNILRNCYPKGYPQGNCQLISNPSSG